MIVSHVIYCPRDSFPWYTHIKPCGHWRSIIQPLCSYYLVKINISLKICDGSLGNVVSGGKTRIYGNSGVIFWRVLVIPLAAIKICHFIPRVSPWDTEYLVKIWTHSSWWLWSYLNLFFSGFSGSRGLGWEKNLKLLRFGLIWISKFLRFAWSDYNGHWQVTPFWDTLHDDGRKIKIWLLDFVPGS